MNRVKLIARMLLPVIVYALFRGLNWLCDLFVYGGFDKMITDGILTDGDARAQHIFNVFLLFLLPFIFFLHWVFCSLSNRSNFLTIKLGFIISTVLLVMLSLLNWSSDMSHNIKGVVESVFLIYPPIVLYFYGLNVTKRDKNEEY